MKIAKKTVGIWHSPHDHSDAWRKRAKLEGWPKANIHPATLNELPDNSARSQYPEAIEKLLVRAATRCLGVSIDKDIMQGQPCVFGTRIPIRSVLRVLEHHASTDAVRESYPHLTTQQIEDVLYFSQIILELPSGLDETAPVA